MTEENLRILTNDADRILARVITKIDESMAKIQNVKIEEPNLENVFLHLTGRVLRD